MWASPPEGWPLMWWARSSATGLILCQAQHMAALPAFIKKEGNGQLGPWSVLPLNLPKNISLPQRASKTSGDEKPHGVCTVVTFVWFLECCLGGRDDLSVVSWSSTGIVCLCSLKSWGQEDRHQWHWWWSLWIVRDIAETGDVLIIRLFSGSVLDIL